MNKYSARRGDTIIEVMFAFAIFSLVAIITVTMMNLGLAASERSLEVTVVRNEMNAQAEALRFIHSSYIAEQTLPENCGPDAPKCQQYKALWETIIGRAVAPAGSVGAGATYTIEMPVMNCSKLYDNQAETLVKNNAFVLNTRQLLSIKSGAGYTNADAYIAAKTPTLTSPQLFFEAPLDARIIYAKNTGGDGNDGGNNSTGVMGNASDPLQQYTKVARIEGIWVVAVRSTTFGIGGKPQYYDFYIGTCWNGSGSRSATSIDTVVRLYNPERS